MGKQRKYTGTRLLLDLLRALRNKKNHYEDMSDKLKKDVGPLPEGYLSFWTRRFPNLLITCWNVVYAVEWDETDRFKGVLLAGWAVSLWMAYQLGSKLGWKEKRLYTRVLY